MSVSRTYNYCLSTGAGADGYTREDMCFFFFYTRPIPAIAYKRSNKLLKRRKKKKQNRYENE